MQEYKRIHECINLPLQLLENQTKRCVEVIHVRLDGFSFDSAVGLISVALHPSCNFKRRCFNSSMDKFVNDAIQMRFSTSTCNAHERDKKYDACSYLEARTDISTFLGLLTTRERPPGVCYKKSDSATRRAEY